MNYDKGGRGLAAKSGEKPKDKAPNVPYKKIQKTQKGIKQQFTF